MKRPSRNIAIAPAARPFIETLEQRRLMAQIFSLFSQPGVFYGPVRPDPGVRAPAAALTIRKAVSTTGPNINVFNISFAMNESNLERGFWIGPTVWDGAAFREVNFSQERVQELAGHVRDGTVEPWTKQKVPQNAFTMLDFELPQLESQPPDFLADRVKWFKETAPDAPVTAFGINIGSANFNRDAMAKPSAATWSAMVASAKSYAPMVKQMDAILVCSYLLGKLAVDRDIQSFAMLTKALRTVYPGKPIVALTWGAYHTTWNPPHSLLSDSVTQRYIDAVRTYFDGAFVWGPSEDNVKLLASFAKPANRVRLPGGKFEDINQVALPQGAPRPTDSPRPALIGGVGLVTNDGIDDLIK